MLEGLSDTAQVALFGLIGGVFLGLAARLGRFCTLGAIEDHLYQGSDVRLRMWGIAIAVAGCVTFALSAFELFDPAQSVYHLSAFSPLAAVIGGLIFGYGMSLSGNCGYGALARLGGGDMRSFVVVLVMGVSAYIMMSGPLAGLRVSMIDATTVNTGTRDYATLLAEVSGLSMATCGLLICGALLVATVAHRDMLRSPGAIAWGAGVGLAIAGGWAGTYWVAENGFSATPVVSHTFTAPLGETMLFLMTSSAGGLTFAVGSVAGVLLGSFLGSLIKGHFRWEACEDPRELKRQILGAVLMGFGAVIALGCTVGQGISAMSVLALSAPITLAAIFAGAALGLRQLIVGFSRSA